MRNNSVMDSDCRLSSRDDQHNKRDRLFDVVSNNFSSHSLVGSFFHGDDMQGCVVAEISSDWYLVEIFDWLTGSSHSQKIYSLSDMKHWSFYDDAEWMRNAYENRPLSESADDEMS